MKQRFRIGTVLLYRLLRTEMPCRYVGTASIFRRHRRLLFTFQADCEARGISPATVQLGQGVDGLDAAGRHRSAGIGQATTSASTSLLSAPAAFSITLVSKLWCRNIAIATA